MKVRSPFSLSSSPSSSPSRLYLLMLLAVVMLISGCASSSAIHPGAANITDSQIYDSLVSVQASIEQAKVEFASVPAAKAPLNKIIVAYNTAQDAYRSYHELAVSGHVPDATSLTTQIAAITQDLVDLQAQFGKKGGAL